MAQMTVVWTDGLPATGTEYGPGDTPVCCPKCGLCVDLIIQVQRDADVLGWMLLDDVGKCGHLLGSGEYVMNVTGTWDAVTVAFETRKAEETGDADLDRGSGGGARDGADLPVRDGGVRDPEAAGGAVGDSEAPVRPQKAASSRARRRASGS